jgi:hypothetical protein
MASLIPSTSEDTRARPNNEPTPSKATTVLSSAAGRICVSHRQNERLDELGDFTDGIAVEIFWDIRNRRHGIPEPPSRWEKRA